LQIGEANFPYIVRQACSNLGTAADQDHLMIGQRFADFKTAEEMTDTQNILTI
jgi:hypothetical protein